MKFVLVGDESDENIEKEPVKEKKWGVIAAIQHALS